MSVLVRPDYKGAVIAYLKAQLPPVFAGLDTNQIGGKLPAGVLSLSTGTTKNMPTFYVAIMKSGGSGGDPTLPIRYPRIDVWCFGSTPYEAARLMRTVDAILDPIPPAITGFQNDVASFTDVRSSSDMMEGTYLDTGWPFTWQSYELEARERS